MSASANAEVLAGLPAEPAPGEPLQTADGVPSFRYDDGRRRLLLHSAVRPLREAERNTASVGLDRDILVVAGFGLGYDTEALLRRLDERKPPRPPVLVVFEASPALLRRALDLRPDLHRLLGDERVRLFTDADTAMAFIESLPTRRVGYLFHRPSVELFPEAYAAFRERLVTHIQRKSINIATLGRFERLWAVNLASNLRPFLRDPGIGRLAGRFAGVPAVLAAAGPSLDEHIAFLKRHRPKVLLVAVDACLRRLLHEDIEPDLVFSVDPQLWTAYFFRLCPRPPARTGLVYEPSCHRLVPASWRGPRMTFDTVFPLVQWVSAHTGGRGLLDMGGSVSTSAFDLILSTGADPIILLGQDMAFRPDRTHSRGSLAEHVLLRRTDRLATLETLSYGLAHNRIATRLRSNSGREVPSDRRMLLFFWWFRDKMRTVKDRRVFTLAENAAAVDGIAWRREEDLDPLLASAPEFRFPHEVFEPLKVPQETLRRILREAEQTLESLAALARLAEEALGLSRTLYDAVRARRPASPTLLKRLDDIDRAIRRRQDAGRLVSMTMQKAIFSITEGYDDFLTDEERADPNLAAARRSISLYEAILSSSRFNHGLLERFVRGLDPTPDSDIS